MLMRLGQGIANNCKGNSGDSGGAPSPYLDGVLDTVCCDLDATIADSYGGSGETWANLIASPADGAGQTDYDFYLGAAASTDGDEPTFTGSAGDAAAYFAMDGSDDFGLKTATPPTALAELHFNTAEWWFAITYRTGSNATQRFFDTFFGGAQTNGVFVAEVSTDIRLFIENGNVNAFHNFSGATTPGNDEIIVVSWSGVEGKARLWHNTATGTEAALAPPDSVNGAIDVQPTIAGSEGGQSLTSGSRVYSAALGNEFLDDTKAAAIISHLETRHGRDYTP